MKPLILNNRKTKNKKYQMDTGLSSNDVFRVFHNRIYESIDDKCSRKTLSIGCIIKWFEWF